MNVGNLAVNCVTAHIADIDGYEKLLTLRQLSSLVRLAKVEANLADKPIAFAIYEELFRFDAPLAIDFITYTTIDFFEDRCIDKILAEVGDFYYKHIT